MDDFKFMVRDCDAGWRIHIPFHDFCFLHTDGESKVWASHAEAIHDSAEWVVIAASSAKK